jgi:hypothetical protein
MMRQERLRTALGKPVAARSSRLRKKSGRPFQNFRKTSGGALIVRKPTWNARDLRTGTILITAA